MHEIDDALPRCGLFVGVDPRRRANRDRNRRRDDETGTSGGSGLEEIDLGIARDTVADALHALGGRSSDDRHERDAVGGASIAERVGQGGRRVAFYTSRLG
jgi:hypothetical protein